MFAMHYAGVTPKEVMAVTGKPLTSVYRWMHGTENAPLDKLWALGCKFQHGFMEGMGLKCEGARVTKTISWADESRLA